MRKQDTMNNQGFSKIWIIVIVIFVVLLGVGIFVFRAPVVEIGELRMEARDTMRGSDMRTISTAQMMYEGMEDRFYQSADYPLSIPVFQPEMPTDPKTNLPYGWIDNTNYPHKFCAYAELEGGGFIIASHAGVGKLEFRPVSLTDCEEIIEIIIQQ